MVADENKRLCHRLRLDKYYLEMSKHSRENTGCNVESMGDEGEGTRDICKSQYKAWTA